MLFKLPMLDRRTARLDSALMLLAVFAGIAMFGFFGLVIGPVLMIIIVTTVSVYLAVYKGVDLKVDEPEPPRKRLWSRLRLPRSRNAATPPATPVAEPATPPAEQ